MPDREKVIKGLEMCEKDGTAEEICYNCPYFGRQRDGATMCITGMCITGLMQDALALLKEQEAVESYNVRWEMGIRGGNCPKCMNWVQRSYNFCPFCGRKVKWND